MWDVMMSPSGANTAPEFNPSTDFVLTVLTHSQTSQTITLSHRSPFTSSCVHIFTIEASLSVSVALTLSCPTHTADKNNWDVKRRKHIAACFFFQNRSCKTVTRGRACVCVCVCLCVTVVNEVRFDSYLCRVLKGKSPASLGPVGNIPVLNLETERRLFLSSPPPPRFRSTLRSLFL